MDPFLPKRSFGASCVPQCPLSTVLVRVHTTKIKRAGAVSTNTKVTNNVSDAFIGTITSNAPDNCLKVGDVVSGYVSCASWINGLSNDNQEYIYVRPEDVWRISVAEAKEFGIEFPTRDSDCTVM